MQAQRLMLETDAQGYLKNPPQLPANTKIEAIFLLLEESTTLVKRKPSAKLKPLTKNNNDEPLTSSIFNDEEIAGYSDRTARQISGIADAFK